MDKGTAGRLHADWTEQRLLSCKFFRKKFSGSDFDFEPLPQTADPVSLSLHHCYALRPEVTFARFVQQLKGDGVRRILLEAGGQGQGFFAGEVAEGGG